jgi:hypothetical protein
LDLLYLSDIKTAFKNTHAYSQLEWFELSENFNQFQSDLFNGIFSYEQMQKLHPAFTPKFLHKMSHCADFRSVLELAEAVLHYASAGTVYPLSHHEQVYVPPVLLNQVQRMNAINWIPSSVSQAKEFDTLVNLTMQLSGSNKTIIFGENRKWLNHDEKIKINNTHINDFLDALFYDLILRQIFQQYSSSNSYRLRDLQTIISYKFNQLVNASINIEQMDFLEKRWHRNIAILEAVKPANPGALWAPLIQDTCIDEINIQVITSEKQLKLHGLELDHCVGGYAFKCLNNKSNILELTDKFGLKSTLELQLKKQRAIIAQHSGYKNKKPDLSHIQVALKLVSAINHGDIVLNKERLLEETHFTATNYAYDIHDLETQEKIYQIYKTTKVLPTILMAKDYQEMLKKTGLLDYITALIEENQEPLYIHQTLARM